MRLTELEVGLVASLVGAAVAITSDHILRWRGDKDRRTQQLDFLCRELRLILETSERRLAGSVTDAFLSSPLPVQAWHSFNATGMAARIDSETLKVLQSFYWSVESANYRAALVPTLLQTAIMATTEEASDAYQMYAQRAAVEPLKVVMSYRARILELLPEVGVVPGLAP